MPAQGEQHNCTSNGNPFEELKPHVSEYTAAEIATLSSRLEKQLGPEYISSRPGAGGGKVHYLAADKCINLANEVFGFNGWSSSIQQVQIDFVDENQTTGKVSLGLSVIVRVTLRDGTFHEDIGYGHTENCKGKAPAFEKAKKEGTTDALKRALRNFGNLLGNCVYDKDYVARVTKLKIAPTKWDPENLHRHQDFAPLRKEKLHHDQMQQPDIPSIKRESPFGRQDSHEDEFGSDDFDGVDFAVPQGDHPDGVTLDPKLESERIRRRNSLPRKSHQSFNRETNPNETTRLSSSLEVMQMQTKASVARSHPSAASGLSANPANLLEPQQTKATTLPQPTANLDIAAQTSATMQGSSASQLSPKAPADCIPNCNSFDASEYEPPIGFFTARAAETIQYAQGPLRAPAFNPHLESPSIRKTPGVDHTKTKPVNRDLVGAAGAPSPISRGTNFVNPQTDKARRVGVPGSASPLQNRGTYKPPQMKRPAEGGRSALGDVTNASMNVPAAEGGDVKRQRMSGENKGGATDVLNV